MCSPKWLGGLGLRHSVLFGMAMAAKLYWRWCLEHDQLWANIFSHMHLREIMKEEISRYPLVQKGSVIWNTLKKGVALIKDGLFWICERGEEALFWLDSLDGFHPITSQYLNLMILS